MNCVKSRLETRDQTQNYINLIHSDFLREGVPLCVLMRKTINKNIKIVIWRPSGNMIHQKTAPRKDISKELRTDFYDRFTAYSEYIFVTLG